VGGCRDEAELKTAIVSKVRDHLRASQLSPAIMNELIREYLLFNDWGNTASVFIPGMMLACFITPAGCPDRGSC